MRISIDDKLIIGAGVGILIAKLVPPKMQQLLIEAASKALVEMTKPSGVVPAKDKK